MLMKERGLEEEDFRALIELVQARLRGIGAPELADLGAYLLPDEASEERQLPSSRDLLIDMLQAFGRYMAVRDRAVYVDALERLNSNSGGVIEDAFVASATPDSPAIALSRAPELATTRADLSRLVARLRDLTIGPRFG